MSKWRKSNFSGERFENFVASSAHAHMSCHLYQVRNATLHVTYPRLRITSVLGTVGAIGMYLCTLCISSHLVFCRLWATLWTILIFSQLWLIVCISADLFLHITHFPQKCHLDILCMSSSKLSHEQIKLLPFYNSNDQFLNFYSLFFCL